MKLHEIRNRVQEIISALHDRGWHSEAFALSNDLYDIGHRPLMADAMMVLEDAERLEEELADYPETWESHPSLTAAERNPSMR